MFPKTNVPSTFVIRCLQDGQSVLQKDSDIGSDGGGLEDLLCQVNNKSYLII